VLNLESLFYCSGSFFSFLIDIDGDYGFAINDVLGLYYFDFLLNYYSNYSSPIDSTLYLRLFNYYYYYLSFSLVFTVSGEFNGEY